jgi:hypothetical protein
MRVTEILDWKGLMELLLRKESSSLAAGQVVDVVAAGLSVVIKKGYHNLSRCLLRK